MKRRMWMLLVCLLACLAMCSTAMAIRVDGIENGVATMEGGVLVLHMSGGDEGRPYRAALTFKTLDGRDAACHTGFIGGEYTNIWEWMVDAPGEYGPFLLTITGGDTVETYEFMGVVPEGQMEVMEGSGVMNHGYGSEPPFLCVEPGNVQAECMLSDKLALETPADGSVYVGEKGYIVDVLWEVKEPLASVQVDFVDVTTGKVVETMDAWEDLEPGYYGWSAHGQNLQLGNTYLCRVTGDGVEVSSRFTLAQESSWTGMTAQPAAAPAAPAPSAAQPQQESEGVSLSDFMQMPLESDGSVLVSTADLQQYMDGHYLIGKQSGVDSMSTVLRDSGSDAQIYAAFASKSNKKLVRPFAGLWVQNGLEVRDITTQDVLEQAQGTVQWLTVASPQLNGVVTPMDSKQLDKLFTKKGNEIPWVFYEDCILTTGDTPTAWQIVPFAVYDGGKGSYNKDMYLYAQRYMEITASTADGGSIVLGAHLRVIITDPDEVAAIIASQRQIIGQRPYGQVARVIDWAKDQLD